MRRTAARWTFAVLSLAVVCLLTLTPDPGPSAQAPFFCITCGAWMQDDINNVLLFAPFGLALAMLGLRPIPAAVAAFSCSLMIEALQYLVIDGRDASAADLITNSLGGGFGALTWRLQLWWPSQAVARRLALPAAVVTGLGFGSAGVWFVPRTAEGPYRPSLEPASGPEPSPARLLQAEWNGRPLQCCPQRDWKRMRDELVAAPVSVMVSAELLESPRRAGRLLTVFDRDAQPLVTLGIDAGGVWGAFATRGQLSGGRDFAVHTPGRSVWSAGDTIQVRLHGQRGKWSIQLDHNGHRSEGMIRQSPILAAYYFLPGFSMVQEPLPPWRWLVAQLPVIVVAIWSARTRRQLTQWASVILLVAAGVLTGSPWEHPALVIQAFAAVLATFAIVTAVTAGLHHGITQHAET